MKKVLKWTGFASGGLVALLVVSAAVVYGVTNARMERTYDVDPAMIHVPEPDSAVLARGGHVATIRGCRDCHGEHFGGSAFIDEAPIGRFVASNLTAGEGGVGATYTDVDWVRAIRHGVGPDGKPLLFMPSYEYFPLGDEDLGALIAYIKSLPAQSEPLPATSVGPLGRVLYLAGEFPLIPAEDIDHGAPRPDTPLPGPTAAYGEYLAVSCTGCHGHGFSGGAIPGTPPSWPPASNLTMDQETGLGSWTEEDFFRALRTGVRPDGTSLDGQFMPWQQTAQMTDVEIQAMWAYLQTLPPTAEGNR